MVTFIPAACHIVCSASSTVWVTELWVAIRSTVTPPAAFTAAFALARL